MKLISMTDYVLKLNIEERELIEIMQKENGSIGMSELHKKSYHNLTLMVMYARFLKQPLTLEMFVPCDEDGNILEEPMESHMNLPDHENAERVTLIIEYEDAKERVLFEVFELEKCMKAIREAVINGQPIESLEWMDMTLTLIAIKQIGL